MTINEQEIVAGVEIIDILRAEVAHLAVVREQLGARHQMMLALNAEGAAADLLASLPAAVLAGQVVTPGAVHDASDDVRRTGAWARHCEAVMSAWAAPVAAAAGVLASARHDAWTSVGLAGVQRRIAAARALDQAKQAATMMTDRAQAEQVVQRAAAAAHPGWLEGCEMIDFASRSGWRAATLSTLSQPEWHRSPTERWEREYWQMPIRAEDLAEAAE